MIFLYEMAISAIFLEVDKIHVFSENPKNRDFARPEAPSLFNLFEIGFHGWKDLDVYFYLSKFHFNPINND